MNFQNIDLSEFQNEIYFKFDGVFENIEPQTGLEPKDIPDALYMNFDGSSQEQHRKYRTCLWQHYFFLRACLHAYVSISMHVCYGGLYVKQLA